MNVKLERCNHEFQRLNTNVLSGFASKKPKLGENFILFAKLPDDKLVITEEVEHLAIDLDKPNHYEFSTKFYDYELTIMEDK